MTDEALKPWYRESWSWFVLAPLIVVVVVSSITATIAYHYSDDVVTDNYYKEGRMINQRLEQDKRALELGLSGELRFDRKVGEVFLSLSIDPRYQNRLPQKLLALLNHPTSAERDRQLVLTEIAPGRYRADLDGRLDYKWYVILIPTLDRKKHNQTEWRLTGEIDLRQQSRLSFNRS
ncbi:MAG: FixH family protein [Exilibacterium sp.]